MSLSNKDAQRLRDAGFLNYEINHFSGAVTPGDVHQKGINLNNEVWQKAMASRRDWTRAQMGQGRTMAQIKANLINYYRKRGVKKRDPYDFIRAEYKNPGKLKDYIQALRRRAKDRIARGLKGTYKRGAGRSK